MERDAMIDYIKSQYLNFGEELCNGYIENFGYYERIENEFAQKRISGFKDKEPFDEIPLCWQGPYSYGGSIAWVMIGGFTIENDTLYVEIYNFHSGPPDYMTIGIDTVPDEVLITVVKILQEKNNKRNLDFYIDETISWLIDMLHTKEETTLFLQNKGLSECEVELVLKHVEPLFPLC